MVTNQQAKQQRKAVEEAATTILAHLDMGNREEVERLLTTTDRHTLGLVVTVWYQMCLAHRGVQVTLDATMKTMGFLNGQAKLEGRPEQEAEADKLAASLLFHLVNNTMARYARAWQRVIEHEPDISSDVAARMLGFVRGMLSDVPEMEAN